MKFSNPHTQTQNTLSAAVFEHYTDKKQDRNLAQASDGYVHHHFGMGPLLINPTTSNQVEIIAEIQRMENKVSDHLIDKLNFGERVELAVDLGCGRGGNLFRILDKYPNVQVHGVNLNVYQSDFCNEQIRLRSLEGRSEVRQANFLSIPYPDGNFTHAYCCEVTQYALDLNPLFVEVNRVLKTGGVFAIATWTFNPEKTDEEIREVVEPINDHYASTMHSLSDYVSNLERTGFKVVELDDRSDDFIPYWELRTHWDMKSGIEDMFIKGHKEGTLEYHFITAEKR